MAGKKRSDVATAEKKKKVEGDLFPRGRAEGSLPRVRKRDGTVLFGGDAGAAPSRDRKRARASAVSTTADGALVSKNALCGKRLAIGMTLLGVVTQASERAVHVSLPTGLSASADPFEVLVEETEEEAANAQRGLPVKSKEAEASESESSDSESDASSEPGSDEGDTGRRSLHKVVRAGDVVRVVVVSAERVSGLWKVVVSCRPSLINVSVGIVGGSVSGARAATTLREGELMWGAVRAVEDHGYVVDFGPSVPTVGFLNFAEVSGETGVGSAKEQDVSASGEESTRKLHPGSPVEVVVLESASKGKKQRKVVRVSADVNKVGSAVSKHVPDMSIASMRAGMRVEARISRIDADGGIELSIFGVFSAVVERCHLPAELEGSVGSTVHARLLYVDAGSKRMGATLLKELVEHMRPRQIPSSWDVGHIIPRATVHRVDAGYGVFLLASGDQECDGKVESVPLFAHASRVSDERVDKLESVFHDGLEHNSGARVVSFSRLDGVVNVDLRQSILVRKALTISEVAPGELYMCKILSHTKSGGLTVAVDGDVRITGVIPAVYLSDTSVSAKRISSHPRFRIGAEMKCACISVDPGRGKVVLSAKRSLVKSTYPLLGSYDQAQDALLKAKASQSASSAVDMCIFSGSVAMITNRLDVLVVFSGGVRGLVSHSEIASHLMSSPDTSDYGTKGEKKSNGKAGVLLPQLQALYPPGRTVAVRVLRVDKAHERMSLTFNLINTDSERESSPQLAPGMVVEARIVGVDPDDHIFRLRVKLPARASSGTASEEKLTKTSPGNLKGNVECALPFAHVSDSLEFSKRIAAEYAKVFDCESSPIPVGDVLILSLKGKRNAAIATMKKSLISAMKDNRMPTSFDDVKNMYELDQRKSTHNSVDASEDVRSSSTERGHILRGYVKATVPTGIVVGFVGNLAGFVHKSRIADEFIADPSRVVEVHQSVSAVIQTVDHDQSRFTLSLRSSDVGAQCVVTDTQEFFENLLGVTESFGRPPVEKEFHVGSVVTSVLDTSRPYGMVLNLESSTGAKAYGVVLDATSADGASSTPGKLEGLQTPRAIRDTAESESIASAAASTALEYASSHQTNKPKVAPSSTRKTRRQKATEDNTATSPTPARVLDVDPFSGVVDVSLDPAIVETAGKRLLSINDDLRKGKIILLKDEYVILSVPRGKSTSSTGIAFALLPGIGRHTRMQLRRGMLVPCRIVSLCLAMRNLAIVDWVAVASGLAIEASGAGVKGQSQSRSGKTPKKNILTPKGPLTPSEVELGMLLCGKIVRANPLYVNIAVSRGVAGRLHISNFYSLGVSTIASLELGPLPDEHMKCFHFPKMSSTLSNLRVIGFRQGSDSSEPLAEGARLELARGSKSGNSLTREPSDLVGQKCLGFLKSSKLDQSGRVSSVWFELAPGIVGHCSDIDALSTESGQGIADVRSSFGSCRETGKGFVCLIHSLGREESPLNLVLSRNGEEGKPFWGRVLSHRPGIGLRVEIPRLARQDSLPDQRWGHVDICDVHDDFDEAVMLCRSVKTGDIVRVKRVEGLDGDKIFRLSMRKSDLDDVGGPVKDPVLVKYPDKGAIGQKYRAFVRSVGKTGCFVSLGREVVARILLSDLSDEFISKPEDEFPPGTLVSGKISAVDEKKSGRVQMSLRKRKRQRLDGADTEDLTSGSKKHKPGQVGSVFTEGSVVSAEVKRVEKYGALVSLGSSPSVALLHRSEADQDRIVADPWKEWRVGQILTVVVLQEGDGGKMRVGTKRCYFEAANVDSDRIDEILERNAGTQSPSDDTLSVLGVQRKQESDPPADVVSSDEESSKESDLGDGTMVVDANGDQQSESGSNSVSTDSDVGEEVADDEATLEISRGFLFDDGEENNDIPPLGTTRDANDSTSDDEVSDGESSTELGRTAQKSSKRKREKKRAKEAAEREIREREEALANRPDAPETAEDFERLLMGSPNSSAIWIRYMAFRVALSQFEKARALAERSLETISLTEELERVNMWIAYINLEASCNAKVTSGSKSEISGSELRNRAAAVFRVFERACGRVTDVEDLHLQVAAALRQSHPDIADEILQRALKSFKDSKEVWCAVGSALFSSGKLSQARHLLERALLSLERQDHVSVIMKFAQLEYRFGSAERGRTVFSSLCANFPKRLDIWGVYWDMEIGRYRQAVKDGNESEAQVCKESVRLLFERCSSLEWSTKKMKFVFKRWLGFEVETGEKEAQAVVRNKARAYVETKLVSS